MKKLNTFPVGARLIEAAPSLLKALKVLYTDADDRGETRDDNGRLYKDWKAAKKAIEAAEGAPFDTYEEKSIPSVMESAKEVVAKWETGDLAGAVRDLDRAIREVPRK